MDFQQDNSNLLCSVPATTPTTTVSALLQQPANDTDTILNVKEVETKFLDDYVSITNDSDMIDRKHIVVIDDLERELQECERDDGEVRHKFPLNFSKSTLLPHLRMPHSMNQLVLWKSLRLPFPEPGSNDETR